MFRNTFYSILFLLSFFCFERVDAFLGGFFASPCGCGRFQAGLDVTAQSTEGFEKCLQCTEVKDFSEIAPYFTAFFRQLEEKYYPTFVAILGHQKCFGGKQTCAHWVMKNAYTSWRYKNVTYRALGEEGDMGRSARRARGRHGNVWKFLNMLNKSVGPKGSHSYSIPLESPVMMWEDSEGHPRYFHQNTIAQTQKPKVNWLMPGAETLS